MTSSDSNWASQLADIHRMFSTALYRQLKAEGIELTRSQWRVIANLRSRPGLTQSELAERLLIEKAPVGTLIDKLEARGLVERRPDPSDRRVKRLYVTDKCGPMQPLIEEVVEQLKNLSMSGLSTAEQQQLLQLLGRVRSNLQTARSQAGTVVAPPIQETD